MDTAETETEHKDSIQQRRVVRLTLVTDSELQTFRSCPQLHDFKYRQRLRMHVDAKPLAVGSIFHAGMRNGLRAGWGANERLPTDQRLAAQILAATQGIDDLVNLWAGKVVEHTKDVDYEKLAADVDQTAAMVKWMLGHYFKNTTGDLTNLLLVETERPFSVVMNDRRGRPVTHLRYTGVRDAVFYDPAYNDLILNEHKTTGNDPRGIEKRVEMDTQTAGYLHALREELRENAVPMAAGTKLVPRNAGLGRVAYNVLRKALPHPPKVNKNGSVSVAAATTTEELYRAALDEQVTQRRIPISEDQREYLSALAAAGDKFFCRVEWYRTDLDIERWRRDTFVDAKRIREADRDPDARTRNTGHCNMPWSLPCSYRQLCLNPDAPELRAQFRVASDIHAEVRAAEVDAAV